jgi:hypothetical protein
MATTRRSPRTPEYVRAAEAFGRVQSVISLIGGIFFALIFVAIGVAILVYTDGANKGWWGGGLIAFGAILIGFSVLNRWAVKNNREYAAFYGATSAIGGLRGALAPQVNGNAFARPDNFSILRW